MKFTVINITFTYPDGQLPDHYDRAIETDLRHLARKLVTAQPDCTLSRYGNTIEITLILDEEPTYSALSTAADLTHTAHSHLYRTKGLAGATCSAKVVQEDDRPNPPAGLIEG